MDPDPNVDGGARTMTTLSPVPSFKVQNPQSPQSRANQTVGHWEAEGTAGKGSEVGLAGDSTKRVPGGVMANTRAGDGAVGTPAQDRDPPGGAGRLLREHRPPGPLPSALLSPPAAPPGPRYLPPCRCFPRSGQRFTAGQFFEASLISKTMRGWEEGETEVADDFTPPQNAPGGLKEA